MSWQKTIVGQGAKPEARDGRGQTTWEVCGQCRTICTQLREFIQNDMGGDDIRSRRGEAPAEEIIRRL